MHNARLVYSVHHASDSFDLDDFSERCALTPEQRARFSDVGSAETVPTNGIALFGTHSRGLVDLNRAQGDPTLFPEFDFGRTGRNRIWLPGKEPTREERSRIFNLVYKPYHERLLATLRESTHPTLLVAWDNTAPYEDFFDQNGTPRAMPSVILSNNGDRNVGTAAVDTPERRITTCEPALLVALRGSLARELRDAGLPHDVYINTYDAVENDECGFIANHYSSLRNSALPVTMAVQSLQVEYNTDLTHDGETLVKNERTMKAMQTAFERALGGVAERFLG